VKKTRAHSAILIAVLAIAASASLRGQATKTADIAVTAVSGESWIRHNHSTFSETSMGKTWDLGPPPPVLGKEAPAWHLELSPGYSTQIVTLHGSDLFRLNCQACHGELGHGAPPEINSITGPVQATSSAATLQRMRKAGREMSQSDANAIAKDSKALLRQRLHLGGQHMPPPTLSAAEIRVLVPYLEQLSEVPGAGKNQIAVKESSYRVGEHVVKSICHICHSATGSNPDPGQILEGAIPPLSTLTTRVSLPEFVRKVTSGATVSLGTPPAPFRGRMPVFPFLSQDEAAAAYQYLLMYPPRP
jgi:mono/diheme cytochrome c family protein